MLTSFLISLIGIIMCELYVVLLLIILKKKTETNDVYFSFRWTLIFQKKKKKKSTALKFIEWKDDVQCAHFKLRWKTKFIQVNKYDYHNKRALQINSGFFEIMGISYLYSTYLLLGFGIVTLYVSICTFNCYCFSLLFGEFICFRFCLLFCLCLPAALCLSSVFFLLLLWYVMFIAYFIRSCLLSRSILAKWYRVVLVFIFKAFSIHVKHLFSLIILLMFFFFKKKMLSDEEKCICIDWELEIDR